MTFYIATIPACWPGGGLAQGLLVNKPAKPWLDLSAEQVKQALNAISNISGNRSKAETAIRYVLHHPAITSAVIGIRTREQLEEAITAGSSAPLTEKEWNTLQNALPAIAYKEHRI